MATPVVSYEFQDHWKGVDGKWYRWKQNDPAGPGFYPWGDNKPSAGREVVRPTDPLLRPDLAKDAAIVDPLKLDTIRDLIKIWMIFSRTSIQHLLYQTVKSNLLNQ